MKWQIAVDTGGTFTDCLATSPSGATRSWKVLSDGSLRATLHHRLSEFQWEIEADWEISPHLLTGFGVKNVTQHLTSTVVGFDPRTRILHLSDPWMKAEPGDFLSFSTGEPAPVLAARLATSTPLNQSLPPIDFRLGTTRATNALLELKGAKTLFITNRGLEDLLVIGDQARPDLFALAIEKEPPLHSHVLGIKARFAANGEELVPLSDTELEELIQRVKAIAPVSIAISLLHSYRYPAHEHTLAQALRDAGFSQVSVSHELAPEIRLLPRSHTAVADAYLSPVLSSYLHEVESAIQAGSLRVMSSAGGLMQVSDFKAKDSLLSGPAGGVVGAAAIGNRAGKAAVLSFDMGGTSTDVARCTRRPQLQYETTVGSTTLLLPSLAVETVAAGGGSVCSFDGQKLRVGPESAGAFPGPACYGAGGPLTVTDINLLLGYIDPRGFIFPVKVEAAQQAAMEMARAADIEYVMLLQGFRTIADELMAGAIKKMALRHGQDPATHSLVCFGGAGGQHACSLASLLHIKEVIVPCEASILSAWGIAHAPVSRLLNRQILLPWKDITQQVYPWQKELEATLMQQLESERRYDDTWPPTFSTFLELRLSGQNYSIEVEGIDNAAQRFQDLYVARYGHWLEGREVECVQMRVLAELITEVKEKSYAIPAKQQTPLPTREILGKPVFIWENLLPEQVVHGPALLVAKQTSVYLEKWWTATCDTDGGLVLTHEKTEASPALPQLAAAAELELFSQRYQLIAEEMGEMLRRTSLSVNVKERLDFSCALLNPDGYLVANAPHVPVHLGSLGICLRKVREVIDLGPGDVVVTNHPAYGGSHLPDVTLLQAVFDEAGVRIGYVVNRAHHAEIGGIRPGSTPPFSTRLAEEGVVIAPRYLVRAGKFQEDEIRALLSSGKWPSRNVSENIGDLRAALAANHAGAKALMALAAREGSARCIRYMESLLAYSEQKIRQIWEAWDWHERHACEYLDDGSPLRVRLALHDDSLTIDFSGSAPVHPGNFNATPAIVHSVVLYVLRLLISENLPLNEGLLRPVNIVLPQGMLHPDFSDEPGNCPAVVGGNTETSQRLTDTLLKALDICGCGQGTMNNFLFGNDHFGFYETIGGGAGASEGHHGAHAVHQHMTNTRLTDPEILEQRYPIRLMHFAVRPDSGGLGKWHGGNGIIREWIFLEHLSVTVLAQHRHESPYGSQGGDPGARGCQVITWPDGTQENLAGIAGVEVAPGTILRMETPGGGGFGKKNAPDQVDVSERFSL
ncbi:MAG: hydantoinase B/oxoprolinase family protein [Bacteroidia bacterium]|nr:hydantoinase B/oxoprolinase family protein [Bacteroidia bacterium]